MKLPDLAAQQYALALHAKAESLTSDEEIPGEIPEELHTYLDDWTFDIQPDGHELSPGIWIQSEHGGVDAVCDFIQHLLKKFNMDGFVAFSWSNDCSKPRVDAFGGGAAFITAKSIQSMSTSQWIAELTNNHTKIKPCLIPVT